VCDDFDSGRRQILEIQRGHDLKMKVHAMLNRSFDFDEEDYGRIPRTLFFCPDSLKGNYAENPCRIDLGNVKASKGLA